MIKNEKQLRHALDSVAKMYRLLDRLSGEQHLEESTREDVVEGIKAGMRQIELEIAEYMAGRPAKVA